jgi:glycosyltransferase involved in cell wall biosynthesis
VFRRRVRFAADGPRVPRAAFVFQNPRARLLDDILAGREPDSTLLGQNHLSAHGIDARVHDPLLSRRDLPGPLYRVAWNARELVLPLELGGADVVFTPLAKTFPLAARVRPRLPVVVVNYGLNLIWRRSSGGARRLLRASLRSAARVVCLGESQRRGVVDEIGIPGERTAVLLLPVDDRWWTPRPRPGGEPLVLTVGKDLARDYATFLAAAADLDARVELAVHPRNLEGLTLPPAARARLVGSTELRELYARATCVVLPQRDDSYPFGSEGGGLTALLEAMAMAKPVVASDRGILRDYVTDGTDALVVPPEDSPALRAAIERVLGDRALAERLGAAARARVERAHTTRAFAAELAPLLRSVV